MKVYNATQIAARIGVSRTHIQAMKRAGFQCTAGLKTTVASVTQWMKEHPDFRHRDAYPRKSSSGRGGAGFPMPAQAKGVAGGEMVGPRSAAVNG